jgi:nucleotide-binding universal stress UspA family protein
MNQIHREQPVFRHILIPLDGSGLAEQILEPALALGDQTQATYTLLHVVEPFVVPG